MRAAVSILQLLQLSNLIAAQTGNGNFINVTNSRYLGNNNLPDHVIFNDNLGSRDRVVYSNNNVNLGNLDAVKKDSDNLGFKSDEPKLRGPNVCTKQQS